MLATKAYSVIIICMKINDNHSPNNLNAETAVQAILDVLSEMFIQPAYDAGELSKEDSDILVDIHDAMKVLGKKAKAYEMLEDQDNSIYRN